MHAVCTTPARPARLDPRALAARKPRQAAALGERRRPYLRSTEALSPPGGASLGRARAYADRSAESQVTRNLASAPFASDCGVVVHRRTN